jgi:hypothetical protein
MKKRRLVGHKSYWLVVPRAALVNMRPLVFPTRRLAEHFIDHRVEGWDGWRLLQAAAWAEHRP